MFTENVLNFPSFVTLVVVGAAVEPDGCSSLYNSASRAPSMSQRPHLNHVGAFCMSVSHCPAEWSHSSSVVGDSGRPARVSGLTHACAFEEPHCSCISFNSTFAFLLWGATLVCVAQVKARVQISV